MRSRTAGVMTTLMRNGRDRRSGKPVKCHARKECVLLFGTRSADYIRASGHSGRIQRPNTWLHPNASPKCQIFPLHRRRRPYMALRGQTNRIRVCRLLRRLVTTDKGRPRRRMDTKRLTPQRHCSEPHVCCRLISEKFHARFRERSPYESAWPN